MRKRKVLLNVNTCFFSFSKFLLRICESHYFTPACICVAFSTLDAPPFVPSSFRVTASLGSSLDNSGRFTKRARFSPIPLCSFSLPTFRRFLVALGSDPSLDHNVGRFFNRKPLPRLPTTGEDRADRVGWCIHGSPLSSLSTKL